MQFPISVFFSKCIYFNQCDARNKQRDLERHEIKCPSTLKKQNALHCIFQCFPKQHFYLVILILCLNEIALILVYGLKCTLHRKLKMVHSIYVRYSPDTPISPLSSDFALVILPCNFLRWNRGLPKKLFLMFVNRVFHS